MSRFNSRPLVLPWVFVEPPPLLPDDAVVERACGAVKCEQCGLTLDLHKPYRYNDREEKTVVKGCDGVFYHL